MPWRYLSENADKVVSEALEALAHAPVREGRPLLLRLYTYYDKDKAGVKRDAGEDLLPIADPGDRALAERGVTTVPESPSRNLALPGLPSRARSLNGRPHFFVQAVAAP